MRTRPTVYSTPTYSPLTRLDFSHAVLTALGYGNWTLLHAAAARASLPIVQWVAAQDFADKGALTEMGMTAAHVVQVLHVCGVCKRPEVV